MANKSTNQTCFETESLDGCLSCEDRYLIDVLRAFLNDREPPRPPEDFEEKRFVRLVEVQSVVGIVADELEKRPEFFSERFMMVLTTLRAKEAFRDVAFQTTRDRIETEFETNGIRYLPLKGAIMKDMYPQSYQRSMCDYDVLVDKSEIQRARTLLKEKLGYRDESVSSQHYCLTSDSNLTTVELHYVFLGRASTPVFSDVWDRAVRVEDERSHKTFQYRFTPEDFYLCMVLHLARHWLARNATIRMFVDVWIFNRKYAGKFDRASVDEPLRNDSCLDFALNVERACGVWFDGLENDKLVEAMARRLFNPPKSGSHTGLDPVLSRKNRLFGFINKVLCAYCIGPYRSELDRLPAGKRALRTVGLYWEITWKRFRKGGGFGKLGAYLFNLDKTRERIAEESAFGLIKDSRR